MGIIKLYLSQQGLADVRLASRSKEEEAFFFRLYQELRPDIDRLAERCAAAAGRLEGYRNRTERRDLRNGGVYKSEPTT